MPRPLSRSESLKGTRVGPYEIQRLIGHGATASVFEALNVELGRRVAIKVLHEHVASDARIRGRFEREGKVAAQVHHPNALDVLDVGEEQGLSYLVMELLEGKNLREHLEARMSERRDARDQGPLDVPSALALILPIASALGAAHAIGAIHRDIKPANILLARVLRGEVRPKLVDFGLSKLADDDVFLTSSDLVVGTAEYMAPEATLGTRYASPLSDEYSLAAVLHECLTGHPPIEAGDFVELIEGIRAGIQRPPSALVAGIPPALDAVILRALHRNPENRYPTVRAFGAALLPFADDATRRTYERDFEGSGRSAREGAGPASGPPSAPRGPAGSGLPVPASGPAAGPSSGPRKSAAAVTAAPPRTPAPAHLPDKPRTPRPGKALSAVDVHPELRPLPCPAGASPFRFKGLPYRGFVHMVSHAIPGGLDAFCRELEDPTVRDFIRQPFLATGRYDVLPIVPLMATAARLIGVPWDTFVRTSTQAQTRYDARTVYKRLYDGATKQDTPARIARFEAQHNDYATFSAWFDGPHKLILQNEGFPAYLWPWFSVMQPAYTEEATAIVGAPARAVSLPFVHTGKREGFDVGTTRCEVRWER